MNKEEKIVSKVKEEVPPVVKEPKPEPVAAKEDTYILSKRAMRREMDEILDEMSALKETVTKIGTDLEKVMGRLGLWAIKNQPWWK